MNKRFPVDVILQHNTGGDWREHKATADKVYERQRKTKLGSEKLYEEVTDKILQKNIKNGNIL